MKNLIALAVALFAVSAFAEDPKTTVEVKKTASSTAKKSTAAVDTKVKTTDVNGDSATDTTHAEKQVKHLDSGGKETTTEVTTEHDAAGSKHDTKSSTKTKVVRDANGKIVEEKIEKK